MGVLLIEIWVEEMAKEGFFKLAIQIVRLAGEMAGQTQKSVKPRLIFKGPPHQGVRCLTLALLTRL